MVELLTGPVAGWIVLVLLTLTGLCGISVVFNWLDARRKIAETIEAVNKAALYKQKLEADAKYNPLMVEYLNSKTCFLVALQALLEVLKDREIPTDLKGLVSMSTDDLRELYEDNNDPDTNDGS